jgi:hypothetical protein
MLILSVSSGYYERGGVMFLLRADLHVTTYEMHRPKQVPEVEGYEFDELSTA